MNVRTKQIIAAALVAVSSVGLIAVAQNGPDAPSAPTAPAETKPVTGSVVGMNMGPDGGANGLLIKTGDGALTQLNFPPHMASEISKAIKIGSQVTANTRPIGPPPPRPGEAGPRGPGGPGGPAGGPDAGGPPAGGPAASGPGPDGDRPAPPPADHPVFELTSITPDGGSEVKLVTPDQMPTQHVDGKVARLNYNREGHVDGAVLDDGTLIHIGGREAEELNLTVGQALSVDGVKPPRAGDNKVLHATKVNGTTIERPKPPAPGEGAAGRRGGPKGAKGPPAP